MHAKYIYCWSLEHRVNLRVSKTMRKVHVGMYKLPTASTWHQEGMRLLQTRDGKPRQRVRIFKSRQVRTKPT
jgi:hypothetical protein